MPSTKGAGSWIGHGAIVLPGTTIGRNVVVAAGSVVRGTIEDYARAHPGQTGEVPGRVGSVVVGVRLPGTDGTHHAHLPERVPDGQTPWEAAARTGKGPGPASRIPRMRRSSIVTERCVIRP